MGAKIQQNYRIVILGCCFAIFFMMIGLVNAPSSLFIVPVSEAYGFSRSAFSLTLSLCTIIGMFINIFFGKLYRSIGIRKMVIIGFAAGVIGYLILWQAKTLPIFYIGGILSGLGMGFNSSTTISLLINDWFSKKQGTLLGLVSAGSGIGGWLFSTMFANIIATQGYQLAYLITAIALFVVMIPLAILLKDKPQTEQTELAKSRLKAPKRGYLAGFKDLLRRKRVRRTFIAAFIFGLICHAVLVATPAHLELQGFDPVFAGTIYGAIYFGLAATKILIGWINDRFGIRAATMTCLSSFLAGTSLLIFTNSAAMAWIFVVVFSFCVASQAVLSPLLAKSALRKKDYCEYLGMYVAAVAAGISAGVPIINVAYDLFGTYVPVMLLYMAIGGFTIYMLMTCLPHKQVKKDPAIINQAEEKPATKLAS